MRRQKLALVVLIILAIAVTLALRAHTLVRTAETPAQLQKRFWEGKEPGQYVQILPDKPLNLANAVRSSNSLFGGAQSASNDLETGAKWASEKRATSLTSERFHGLYPCQIGTPCPSYSASFLTSRAQLLSNPVKLSHMRRANTNMETASYHAMGSKNMYDVWRTVDALDFAVEHLSMYERMIQSRNIPPRTADGQPQSPIAEALYETFVQRLRGYESHLTRKCGGDEAYASSSRRSLTREGERTVGVMPYYAAGGTGSGHTRFESKALYLNITIRSLRCHFGGVAVSCLHPEDRAYLEAGRGLPVLDDVLWIDPEELPVKKPSFLGVSSVRRVQQLWANANSTWSRAYDYVYYTEADQVLHLREQHLSKFYRCLNERNARTRRLGILTPHRLNALPRTQDYADVVRAFGPPQTSSAAPDEAQAIRSRHWGLSTEAYKPLLDPWHKALFGREDKGGWIRRELNGYGTKNLTRIADDLADGSCCYLKSTENAYPYNVRGKSAGIRLDDVRAGLLGAEVDRLSPVQLLAIGDHGLAILAGLCCHICPRKGRLGRHCDNFCTPAVAGDEDCAVGQFADPASSSLVSRLRHK